MKKILVIDDDSYICDLLVNYLEQHGYDAEGTYRGTNGLKKIQNSQYDLVLCDFRLPDSDGMEILFRIKQKLFSLPVIIMTAYTDIKTAVKLIKAGAFDYITKPIQPEELILIVQKALQSVKGESDYVSFQEIFITGKNEKMKQVMKHVEAVAPTDMPVLIQGETGSGKEFIARAIHFNSKRRNKPFIAVDCGALPNELANSELFGHVKGSFTGALNDKTGYFEHANGGTLFLDEVGNLPYENQVKLLRALQENIINRVGDNKKISVDVRILAATNEDLLSEVTESNFREDLYHRLNGFKINLPALRERKEDIFVFARNFLMQANKNFGKNVEDFDDKVKEIFLNYPWYGNIRELENVVKRCVLLTGSSVVTADTLPDEIKFYSLSQGDRRWMNRPDNSIFELREATLEAEREVISSALKETNFNKSKAARILNIDRKTLYNKIKQYDIAVIKG